MFQASCTEHINKLLQSQSAPRLKIIKNSDVSERVVNDSFTSFIASKGSKDILGIFQRGHLCGAE